jgi:hypothetical protein
MLENAVLCGGSEDSISEETFWVIVSLVELTLLILAGFQKESYHVTCSKFHL